MHVLETPILSPRSPVIAGFLKNDYNLSDLVALEKAIEPSVAIALNPLDRVCASARTQEGEDPTHYDAVWVRDSVWAYYGLRQRESTRIDAKLVLKGLLEYFSTPEQTARLDRLIQTPALAQGPQGAMEVLHIRFDGRAPLFSDVQVDGRDQIWNHKQNDAVALVALAVGEALLSGEWETDDVEPESWKFLLRLPTYWESLGFDSQEDAGAWEEIERINSSSVGLVTSSLEVWGKLAAKSGWAEFLGTEAARLKLVPEEEALLNGSLSALVERGYARLKKQLPFESPDYPKESLKYREADAALLNLVFPCRLDGLSTENKRSVLASVETLVRERGILRYVGDAYQSGNYWVAESEDTTDSRTDDHSTPDAFRDRAKRFIPGTEAEWFFDSWMSQCYGLLYQQTGDAEDYRKQLAHFNRALCQLTGPQDIGADGKPVPPMALPESYNTRVEGLKRWYVPSPITPLNWSKACLTLALDSLRASLRLKAQ